MAHCPWGDFGFELMIQMMSSFSIHCKAILFDLDGTLIDSAARIRRLWQTWGERHGIEPETIFQVMHGRRAGEIIQRFAPHLNVENEIRDVESDEISDMNDVQAYAGALELLNRLSAKQWAIVTSGSRQVAEARLRHVNFPIPSVFITSEKVNAGKPAPDGYLLAAQQLHVQPTECVVIEDAPAGVKAGKAAGMRVIAVVSTHTRVELQEADRIMQRLADLKLSKQRNEVILRYQP
ncbi:MAG TPA: HAD family hydrolase [Anaerolineales bacterium]|nr:HAD family hydrolase [Anaerolineales bacterium]